MTEQTQLIANNRADIVSDRVVADVNNDVVDPKKVRQYVFSASSGTALEYFDFAIYGLATALIFNPLFFPNISPMAGFLASFATYAIGFFARAVGGVVLGYYGDRLGRKFVLVLTIGLMGGATVAIGLLPTYHQIGIWAPVLLVMFRIAQGFGAGAEIASAQTMLAEVSPRNKRGLISSFVSFGTNAGTIVALGIWLLISKLPEESLLSWGWRIPFLASILVVAYTLWMRRHLEESPAFTANEERQESIAFGPYMKDLLTNGRRSLLRSVGLRIGESGPSSFYQVFLVGYIANVLHFDKTMATNALLITSFALFAIIPLVGILCDKVGRRPMYLFFTGWTMVWCIPAIWMISTGDSSWILLAFFGGYGIGVVGTYVVQLAYMPELYGSKYRNGGLAASKEFGGMISGGLVPFVCAGIAALTESVLPIAGYIIALAAIAFFTALKSPETKGRDLFLEEDA